MEKSPRNSTAGQFNIKRLFWTMIVASVVFKIADMTGLLGALAGNWEFARGNGRVVIVLSIVVFSFIAMIYIGWIGIRLPHLVEQFFEIRKKRINRREKYRQEFDSWRKN